MKAKRKLQLEVISLLQVLVKISEEAAFSGFIRLKESENSEIPGFYILIQNGFIIGITGGKQIIADKLVGYGWASAAKTKLLVNEVQEKKEPLLKIFNKYGIEIKKAKHLFNEQIADIVQRIGQESGLISWGKIDNDTEFPYQEITGFKMLVEDLIYKALEENFAPRYIDKLPEKSLIVKSTQSIIPRAELSNKYAAIKKYTDCNLTIEKIAQAESTTIEDIKRRVFILEQLNIVQTSLPEDLATAYLSQINPRQRINKNQIAITGQKHWKTPVITIGAINLGFILLTWLGIFQNIEFNLLDKYFKLRGTKANDTVTLVTIDDKDISKLKQYPVNDELLATAITNVIKHEPTVIGIDIYRDIPVNPGHDKLLAIYQDETRPSIIGVEKIGGSKVEPPPILKDSGEVGFSDLIEDSDKILRRALVMVADDLGNSQFGLGSFVGVVALLDRGVDLQQENENSLTIGKTKVNTLTKNSGGYWKAKVKGFQVLLDYRHKQKDFISISFSDAVAGNINPQQIKDKIVLFGVNADSIKDYVYTPFSRNTQGQTIPEYGVVAHANIASMIYDYGMGIRKPLRVSSKLAEIGYIVLYSLVGVGVGIIGLDLILKRDYSRTKVILGQSFIIASLGLGAGIISFFSGWWIPGVVPVLVGIICGGITNLEYKNNLENLVYVDRELKIPNRFYFDFVFANSIKKTITQDIPTGLVLVQIDCKEKFDDPREYIVYLAEIARTIKAFVRATDPDSFVSRYEKNYLAMVIYQTNFTKIEQLINKIRTDISDRKSEFHRFNLKFGIAISNEIIKDPETMKMVAAENLQQISKAD